MKLKEMSPNQLQGTCNESEDLVSDQPNLNLAILNQLMGLQRFLEEFT